MNKKKSKVLAFLLATAMLVPSSNGIVSAADLNVNREVVKDVTVDSNTLENNIEKVESNQAEVPVHNLEELKKAFENGGVIRLENNIEVDEVITITKDVTLNLNGYTIINNHAGTRILQIHTNNFIINANGGGMQIANEKAYGFMEIGKAEVIEEGNNAIVNHLISPNVIINGGNYKGNTDNGALFKIYSASNIKFKNLNVDTNNEGIGTRHTQIKVDIDIEGGTYSTGLNGIYIDTKDGLINFKNVEITSKRGACVEMAGGNSIFDNCDFKVTGDFDEKDDGEEYYPWARAAIGLGAKAVANVNSGTYTAKTNNMKENEGYGAYIYTSGGTLNINGGTFIGKTASLRADVDSETYGSPSIINVNDGNFVGDIFASTDSGEEKVTINGGKFEGLTERTTSENNNLTVNGGIFDKNMNNFLGADVKYTLKNEDDKDNIKYGYFETQEETLNSPIGGKVEIRNNGTQVETEDVKFVMDKDVTITIPTEVVENKDTQKKEIVIEVKDQEQEGYEFIGFRYRGRMYKPGDKIVITEEEFSKDKEIELVAEWKKEGETPEIPSIPSKPIHPTYDHTNIIGSDRYETAGKIADKLGSYDTAVLVNATSTMSDGLSAAGLAGKEDAAILLVKKDSIPKATMDRLSKVKKVYIIGGENAISQKVVNQLKKNNVKVNVERLGGKTRVETSELVAKEIGSYKRAFVVNGFKGEADAMSASSVAAREEAPILLTNGKSSSTDRQSGVSYYVVGGKSVMNDSIVKKYKAERIAGDDRYETNREMINEFYGASETLYFANGETLVDALTASTISKDDGLVLVGRKSDNKILNKKNTIQVGGMKFDVDFEK